MHKYWEHAICILVNKHGYICVYLEQDLKFGRQNSVEGGGQWGLPP